jgi:hypothetical protein
MIGIAEKMWLIVDDVLGKDKHRATLRWHLQDLPLEINSRTGQVRCRTKSGDVHMNIGAFHHRPLKFEIVRDRVDAISVQGIASPHYGDLIPSPVVEAEFISDLPMRLYTFIVLGDDKPIPCVDKTGMSEVEIRLIDSGRMWSFTLSEPVKTARNMVKDYRLTTIQ